MKTMTIEKIVVCRHIIKILVLDLLGSSVVRVTFDSCSSAELNMAWVTLLPASTVTG
jgi:hypothetical protein